MPALTHGRVRNGFNQYARSVTYAQSSCKGPNGEQLACCKKKLQQQPVACGGQKNFCCGRPITPFKIINNGCITSHCRVPHGTTTRKRAMASGGVGSRSFSVRRAIGRRVQNRNQVPVGTHLQSVPTIKGFNPRTGIRSFYGDECEKTSCGCCLPTLPVPAPRLATSLGIIY